MYASKKILDLFGCLGVEKRQFIYLYIVYIVFCVGHIVFQIQKLDLVYLHSGHHMHIETHRAFGCANAKLMFYWETGGRRGEEDIHLPRFINLK